MTKNTNPAKTHLLRSADEFDAKAAKQDNLIQLLTEHGGEADPFHAEAAANYRRAAEELRAEAALLP